MELDAPTLTSDQVARLVDLPGRYFTNNFRNSGQTDPEGRDLQIHATTGSGTRDQLWSPRDASICYLVHQIDMFRKAGPKGRKNLFEDLRENREIDAAFGGEARWLVVTAMAGLQVKASIESSAWKKDPWMGSYGTGTSKLQGPAMVWPLHVVLPAFVKRLRYLK